MQILRLLLYPISFLYGLLMIFRNCLFDIRILPSFAFPFPVVGVGNLSYGGTGKTPHIEYLIRLLSEKYSVGTISRGYGRKSKGFFIVTKESRAEQTGDEPLQLARKFDRIKVAVHENRRQGILMLTSKFPGLDLILMDDSFQHRYVHPGCSILLTDYHRLYSDDFLLPTGTLREFSRGAKRADIIIVTKTPKIFSPITRRRILEDLNPKPNQKVVFSYLKYGDPLPVFEDQPFAYPEKVTHILLMTGIANDSPLQEHLKRMCSELSVMKFPDHHLFRMRDIETMNKRFNDLFPRKKVIITTEKDVMRLKTAEFSNFLKKLPLFYLPVEIDFHGEDKETFNNYILHYVETNTRNNSIS